MSTCFDIVDLGRVIMYVRLQPIQDKMMSLDELETGGTETGLWADASNARGLLIFMMMFNKAGGGRVDGRADIVDGGDLGNVEDGLMVPHLLVGP